MFVASIEIAAAEAAGEGGVGLVRPTWAVAGGHTVVVVVWDCIPCYITSGEVVAIMVVLGVVVWPVVEGLQAAI